MPTSTLGRVDATTRWTRRLERRGGRAKGKTATTTTVRRARNGGDRDSGGGEEDDDDGDGSRMYGTEETGARGTTRDRRFASEEERQRAIDRLSPPSASSAASFKGTRNKFDGADALREPATTESRKRNEARERAVEKRRMRKERESREMMDDVRRAIERAPIEGKEGFAEANAWTQAGVATKLVEWLTEKEGFGAAESMFGVVSWMSDEFDALADEAEAAMERARRERGEPTNPRVGAEEAKEDRGLVDKMSSFLRQWFSIDIEEVEPGRKQVTVNASAEFLLFFLVLLVASAQFGGDFLANTFGTPVDPLLR
jgi:hypothetical protein